MNICQAVTKRIRKLLKERNMTLYALEQEACILHGTMMRIIHGNNKNITLKTVMQIASGFNMKLIEFLDDPIFESDDIEIY